ncbi:signal peptidase I [Rossellomorea marisflavi]|uniref:Signal peptidase I n=2 Tax=Rossellomorea marisflavi TaxID=189381 RepID=A0A0J5Y728_9BACI|nr:signal peptidase I [Rossellomorea marisflavi]KMK96839.1 signal peptidase [Rossellomorea marisflavi]KML06117.1 signal peptidase [Rossellomorea marisflavi]KML33173.1 signal peptidase [Rossellomorea marisflavi]KZE47653.1 S26 family signal peptidase [Rossellomorea marisflavi]MCM2603850.1 signal peptidase I [Rossellomorea marisflavi]
MKEQIKKEGLEWIKALAIGLIIFIVIRTFLFSNYVVDGESMMPTLQDGNKLVVNKIGYQIGDLHRFDVLVFHANEKEDYVKRVIGLPGDTVTYKNDKLYINGKYYEEPYLDTYKAENSGGKLTGDFTLEELTGDKKVPKGKLFVLGDNRRGSEDSRYFGFIDREQVVGKVNLRYWPLNEWDVQFKN